MAAKVTVGLVQMDVLWGDPEGNLSKCRRMLDSLGACQVALLPELWSCSYDNPNLGLYARSSEECIHQVADWCSSRTAWCVAGSLPWEEGGLLYNRSFVIDPSGSIEAHYDKVHLFPLLDEPLNFHPGGVPLVGNMGEIPYGVVICHDLRFPEYFRRIALEGPWVVFICAQWPASRVDAWRTLLRARAIENQLYVVAVNRCGEGGGDLYGGHSMVVAPDGGVLLELGEDEGTATVELDMAILHRTRKAIRVFESRRVDLYGFPGEV